MQAPLKASLFSNKEFDMNILLEPLMTITLKQFEHLLLRNVKLFPPKISDKLLPVMPLAEGYTA